MEKAEQDEERRQDQKVQQNPEEIAEPAEKSDISPLEQAFDAGFFAEVAGGVKEDDRIRRRENAQVGPEIQVHLYRDSGLLKLQKAQSLSLALIQSMQRSNPASSGQIMFRRCPGS